MIQFWVLKHTVCFYSTMTTCICQKIKGMLLSQFMTPLSSLWEKSYILTSLQHVTSLMLFWSALLWVTLQWLYNTFQTCITSGWPIPTNETNVMSSGQNWDRDCKRTERQWEVGIKNITADHISPTLWTIFFSPFHILCKNEHKPCWHCVKNELDTMSLCENDWDRLCNMW